MFDEQIRREHDVEFPQTEFDDRFNVRPTVKGLVHAEEKLHQTLGVPYVHVQATGSTLDTRQVETLGVPYV